MKPEIPDDLVAQIARQNGIAFVGAGLSASLGLPGWPRLIRLMIDWCDSHGIALPNRADIESLLSEGKLLNAADALRAKTGDDKYHQFLQEIFLRPGLKPTEVHKILAKIPFVGAATTNYDPLVEEGYRETHPGESANVFTQVDYEQLGTALHAKRYFVLKAHGTIERPETIVLGTKDYSRLIHRSEGYRTFLRAMFLHRTVLFIGFSMTDPELLLLLGELKELFEGNTPTHYALMDVSNTTETEREQFEENYRVKIIPYTPSAVDHPEVKDFLTELDQKVAQQAPWYLAEELRKVAETDDPHYRAVVNSDSEFTIKEKYDGAAEDNPFKISTTLKFDTTTPEGKEAHEAMKRHLATGEPVKVKGKFIANVEFPQIINRLVNITEHVELSIGTRRGAGKPLPVKVMMECDDGETAVLDNIQMENIQSGDEQMILTNENQDVPWKFRQVIKDNDRESDFSYTFNDVGLPVKRALEGLRFSRALSKGGVLRIESVNTGSQLAHAPIPPGKFEAPDPLLIQALEALEIIQKKTHTPFTSPASLTLEDVNHFVSVAEVLKTGKATVTPPVYAVNVEQAKDALEKFGGGATVKFMEYLDEWVAVIQGQHVSLSPVLVTCEQMCVTPEDLEELRQAVESGSANGIFALKFSPVPGSELVAKYPNWLPEAEAREVLDTPLVRATSLKNIIRLLYDAARAVVALNVEEFITLLDGARGETSERGIPLSPLGSATPEELLTAFEPVLAELQPEEKLKLGAALHKGGWLPRSEAVQLSGADEAAFNNELNNQGGGQKAQGAS
jgi:hypothetical protein